MGSMLSSASFKREYNKDQADSLRRQSEVVRIFLEDEIDAARLEKLAVEADQKAVNYDEQIKEVVRKVSQ